MFTIHLILCDEAQLVNADFFNTNIAPMTSRTGGITIIQGTSLPEANQLLYATYRKKSIDQTHRVLFNAIEVYLSIALRSVEEADVYWQRYIKEASDNGVLSDYIQSQYFVSFNIKGDRWVELGAMEEDGIFSIKQYGIEYFTKECLRSYNKNDSRYYRIGSFDSAKKRDLAAFTAGILECTTTLDGDSNYHVYTTDFITVNEKEKENGIQINPDQLTERLVSLCIKYELDMLVYETSAQQTDRAYYLAKELKRRNVQTKVIPIDYARGMKQRMFEKVEGIINTGRTSTLDLEMTKHSKSFKEFIEELKIFKKIYEKNSIKFSAPDGRGLHDDFISAWVQMVYLPYYIEYCEMNGISADLDAMDFDYPIMFYKANRNSEENSQRGIMYYR